MTTACGKPRYLELAGVWPLKRYRVRRVAAIFLAISPPIACAFLASELGRWDLFERSGSITTAIGLLLASRRYIRYSVLELAVLQAQPKSNVAEILEDIYTAKLGLALSAFGTIIWGWGKYLGWASFTYLMVWAVFAARDARRDFNETAWSVSGQHTGRTDLPLTVQGDLAEPVIRLWNDCRHLGR